MTESTALTLARERFAAGQPLAGGVSASARYNPALGTPIYVARAEGSRLWTPDGAEFIDCDLSHGAALLGHGHPAISHGLRNAIATGVLSGLETEHHRQAAAAISTTVPAASAVRFATSGSEANLVALRLARSYTGKTKLLKFHGHFHGLVDYFHCNARASAEELAESGSIRVQFESSGIPRLLDSLVIVAPWNDQDVFRDIIAAHHHEIAAVICEPVNYNAGCVLPHPGFLDLLLKECNRRNIVLIFDEVLSGFRMSLDCAQGYFGVTPDICTLAKAIGNGTPVAAVAGREDIMAGLAPSGDAAHSGTYSGNLMGVTAVERCLAELSNCGVYENLNDNAEVLGQGMRDLFGRFGIPATVRWLGARFGLAFGVENGRSFAEMRRGNIALRSRFIRALWQEGVYLHDYGALAIGHFGISTAHTREDIESVLVRMEGACEWLKRQGHL